MDWMTKQTLFDSYL